ncbi:hypothetical protein NBRC111894_1250 [Sporolactobacillus inulinus]|uniref:Uncharacterized protein n=1 Tax=Sporolactobacillus inulinus TaxID=2078 RepID=A0A4Y1Z9L1_9BACL|nr:hypothetical protein NBRC111894_1250 [Sporolactobacillus inulinus]
MVHARFAQVTNEHSLSALFERAAYKSVPLSAPQVCSCG